MKSLKKTLVLLVVLSMLLSAISPVFAASFTDEIPEAYWEYANKLRAVGVMKGDEAGRFNATSNITRAEMATIVCKMVGLDENMANANMNNASVFSDVPAGQWYTGWVNMATGNGIIAGFTDGTFRPNDPLTLNQAITLVEKATGKGQYIDKMGGTWPGNYLQEAAKDGLTTKLVKTEGELATRGNVAILCWEGLQVPTWDVNSSTVIAADVELSKSDSLMVKYFKDFVAGKGTEKDPKRVKLVENAVVIGTGRTTTQIAPEQVALRADDTTKFDGENSDYTIAGYINAQNKPKNAKTATYDANNEGAVIAYVPADVADTANLAKKKVTVLFGKDNEVALIYATDDAVDEAYVTSWNKDTKKIEIDGTTYTVNKDAEVSVFDYVLVDADDEDAINTIDDIIVNKLGVAKPSRTFNRALKADITLDSNDKVETINFTFGEDVEFNVGNAALKIEQGIVESISNDKISKVNGNNFFGGKKVDVLDDDDEIRVLRDGTVATFASIEEGDVITSVSYDGTIRLVYVSSDKKEGTVTSIKNDTTLNFDGDEVYTIAATLMNTDGDLKNAKPIVNAEDYDDIVKQDVEVYLNFVGEAVGIVAETTGTDKTVGIVMKDAADSKFDRDKKATYLDLYILTKDDKVVYSVYNEGKDVEEANNWDKISTLEKGTTIIFSANADNEIKAKDIVIPEENTPYTIDSKKEVKMIKVDDTDAITAASESRGRLEIGGTKYTYSDDATAFNVADPTPELVKNGWNSIIKKDGDEEDLADMEKIVLFAKGSTILYFIADFNAYQSSDDMYGMVVEFNNETIENEDGDVVKTVKIFEQTGEEATYEVRRELLDGISELTFVTYTVQDGKIDTITPLVKDMDKLNDLDAEKLLGDILPIVADVTMADSEDAPNFWKSQFKVDSTGKLSIDYVDDAKGVSATNADETVDCKQLKSLDLDKDEVVVFDLSDVDDPTIASLSDVTSGKYVVGFKSATDEDVTILVIFD